MQHHPDIDIRYPDRVHVVLTTHSSGGLTELDADMARTISALAAEVGATSEPSRAQALEVAIDAIDIPAVLPFWRAVLGYVDDGPHALRDQLGFGPAFWFQQMDAPRPQRNRIHIDVTVSEDEADARIAAALAAGGTLAERPCRSTRSGCSPTPRATKPASAPGRTVHSVRRAGRSG